MIGTKSRQQSQGNKHHLLHPQGQSTQRQNERYNVREFQLQSKTK